jgi:transposase-like protein
MNKHDSELLAIHLRKSVRNFALYEAVATGACTVSELAHRMGVSPASLHVKLARTREAAKKKLAEFSLSELLPDEDIQRDSLD